MYSKTQKVNWPALSLRNAKMLGTLKKNEARGPGAEGRGQDKSNNLLFHHSEDGNDNENY